MKSIIYSLNCPITKNPVYIGKSEKGISRPFEHINEKSHSFRVNEWVQLLKKEGHSPIIVILEQDEESYLLSAKEIFWINYYISKGFLLLNINSVSANTLDLSLQSCINPDYLIDIRNYIRTRRKTLKLTQAQLSKKSGVGLRFIREIEQGAKTNFSTDTIYKLLTCIGRTRITLIID